MSMFAKTSMGLDPDFPDASLTLIKKDGTIVTLNALHALELSDVVDGDTIKIGYTAPGPGSVSASVHQAVVDQLATATASLTTEMAAAAAASAQVATLEAANTALAATVTDLNAQIVTLNATIAALQTPPAP